MRIAQKIVLTRTQKQFSTHMCGEDAIGHDRSIFLRPLHVEPMAIRSVAQDIQRPKKGRGQARKMAQLPAALAYILRSSLALSLDAPQSFKGPIAPKREGYTPCAVSTPHCCLWTV